MELHKKFEAWLDKYLSKELPEEIVAVNFNLYEGADPTYHVELIGCDSFDEDDDTYDWACNDVFNTREDLFFVPRTDDISQWQQGLVFITGLVTDYLIKGKYADKLKSYEAVGIGFVGGDIDIIYPAE